MRKYFGCVGSRKTPVNILKLIIRLGRTLTDLGFTISSGDAYGADRAFYFGSKQSKRFKEVGATIYLIRDGYLNRRCDGFIFLDASLYQDKEEVREKMAEEARGGFWGLGKDGIALHKRNVLQIHGPNLDQLVEGLFLYAETTKSGKIKGGTNTAYQLAVKANVPLIKNLYLEEDLTWCLNWLKENELDYPYQEIVWNEIIEIPFIYTPDKDGIDHINIYSKSKNRLGYLLSNWAHTPFTHTTFGKFNNIESFYAYLCSGYSTGEFRTTNGFEAKQALKKIPEETKVKYRPKVIEALKYKFEQTQEIIDLFSLYPTLPFTHYYYYGDVTNPKVQPNKGNTWLEDTWNEIRNNHLTNLTLEKAKANNL